MGFLASFRALVGYIGYLLHKARRRSHLIVQADQAALGAMKCSIMQFSKPYLGNLSKIPMHRVASWHSRTIPRVMRTTAPAT